MVEEQHIVADRSLIRTARVISAIFTPFSIPFLAFLILFLFSYLRIMPIQYKLIVLGVVYCFTILMPTLTIFLFRKINGFSPEDLGERKRRFMPFLLTITSYVFCLVMMHRLNIPWYMTGIILAALIMMVICIVVNLKWKLSEHMAGVGAIVGGIFQCPVRIQSGMVAMFVHPDCRCLGHSTYYFTASYIGRGTGRFCRRIDLLLIGASSTE